MLLRFGLFSNQNHEALEDCQDLLALVRTAKPVRCFGWYFDFLMDDAYKKTSYFLKKYHLAAKPVVPCFCNENSGWPIESIQIKVGNIIGQFPYCRFKTGSSLSYLRTPDLRRLGIRSIMRMPPNLNPTDHCGQEVTFKGFFDGEVTFNCRRAIVRFYVSDQVRHPSLGRPALNVLL